MELEGETSTPMETTSEATAYDYLVIVDFVRTRSPAGQDELISFSWVIVEPDQTIKDAMACHICPMWSYNLQQQVIEECGLDPQVIRNASMLQPALAQFHDYLSRLGGKSFCFIADGCEGLQQLKVEVAQKRIELQPYFHAYFDIRQEFARAHPSIKRVTSLQTIADYLDIGDPLSPGTEKCKVMTQVVQGLFAQGHVFAEPLQLRLTSEQETAGGGVVRLRGLSYSATEHDVKAFFVGLDIAPHGISIVLTRMGRPSGEAFVHFASADSYEKAKEYHRRDLNKRFIEVFPSSIAEMNAASFHRFGTPTSAAQDIEIDGNTHILRLRGLDYQATPEQIEEFLTDVSERPKAVHIVRNRADEPTGDGFVEYEAEQAIGEAMRHNGERMGSRTIELFRASRAEMIAALQQRVGLSSRGGDLAPSAPEGHIVRMRGIPYTSSTSDLFAFFSPLAIMPLRAHIVYDATHRPTGDAFVVFNTAEEATSALTLSNQKMGPRYIELFQSNPGELARALASGNQFAPQWGGPQRPFHRPGPGGRGAPLGGYARGAPRRWGGRPTYGQPRYPPTQMHRPPPPPPPQGPTVRMRGLPHFVTVDDVMAFFRGYDAVRSTIVFLQRDGRFVGEARISFNTEGGADRAVRELNNKHMRDRYIELRRYD